MTQRPRVLVSAYACGPGDESEASAGWALVRAAAEHHDVWLITRQRFAAGIDAALRADSQLAGRLTVRYLDLSPRLLAFKKRGIDVYWYYALWQRALLREARRLHADVGFDVTHHVTFAADWLPCGLRRLRGVPLVWGRSAAPRTCRGAWSAGSGRGRRSARRPARCSPGCRRLWGDPVARRAAVVVAQNDEVARRFGYARRVVTEPNAALDPVPRSTRRPDEVGHGAIFVARLVGWKGARIAVSALADPRLARWTLDLYGAGPDEARVRALADRLDVTSRVRFHGQTARADVLEAMSRADVLVFPSLHDSAGWAVGEASAAGCAVVCFDHGGPLLAGPNAHLARLGRGAVASVAAAVERAARSPVVPYERWTRDRFGPLVDDWYRDAMTQR